MITILMIVLLDIALSIYGILTWIGVAVLYHNKSHLFEELSEYFLFKNWMELLFFPIVIELLQQTLIHTLRVESNLQVRKGFTICFVIGGPLVIYAMKFFGISKI